MGFAEAVRTCMSKYVTWEGRATRPEFWWFYLFTILVVMAAVIVDTAAGTYPLFYAVAGLALFLPVSSATVRRLHDTDRSGWAYWIGLIPLIGGIILLVWLASQGTYGGNKYGNDPRMVPESTAGAV